ncbi:hypothetical protein BG19_4915 [Burkholderia pseudomallei MSHR840]|nr:hypothetical protein BG19_4915 [Burkholderia pseudomallei MSHR840]
MPADIRLSIAACIAVPKRSRTITRPITVPQQPPSAWPIRATTMPWTLVAVAHATLAPRYTSMPASSTGLRP